MELPGFSFETPKVFRDHRQVWVEANNDDAGVTLTAFIEKVPDARDASSCRKHYAKSLKDSHVHVSTSERGEMALAEYEIAWQGSAVTNQRHLHAYLHREGFCVDLHLSKAPFKAGEEGLFTAVLDASQIGPATDDELTRAASYSPSSGPGEELVLEAGQKLRAKDFVAADALLSPLCPWEDKKISAKDRVASPECSLRIAATGEARGIKNPKELALIYWRAADMMQKEKGYLDAAQVLFEKSLDLDPNDSATWYSLGQLHRDKQSLDAAAEAFTRALQLKPGDPDTLYWLATNQMDQGKLAEAEATLQRVLDVDPKYGRVWYRKGQIQMKRGDYKEAIESFNKAKSSGVDPKKVRERIDECTAALSKQ